MLAGEDIQEPVGGVIAYYGCEVIAYDAGGLDFAVGAGGVSEGVGGIGITSREYNLDGT